MAQKLTLISYKTCPFAMRAAAILHQKKVPFELEYVDLKQKPEWFLKLSPLGKVPLLKVNDDVIFESNVIVEYIDEAYAPSLTPQDTLLKSLNRSYFSYATEILNTQYQMILAQTPQDFFKHKSGLQQFFNTIENMLTSENKYFNGNEVHLIDISFIPIIRQNMALQPLLNYNLYEGTPKFGRYAENMHQLECLQKCTTPDYDELFLESCKRRNSFFLTLNQKPIVWLASHCPFCIRVLSFLEQKKIQYELRHVDLENKDEEFLKISPLEKVPLVQVELQKKFNENFEIGDKVLFESRPILEYFDEILGNSTIPIDPLERAELRAYLSLVDELQMVWFGMRTKEQTEEWIKKVHNLLQRINLGLPENTPYFFGNDFGFADSILAPALKTLQFFQGLLNVDLLKSYPKLDKYAEIVIQNPAFQRSLPSDFNEKMQKALKKFNHPLAI